MKHTWNPKPSTGDGMTAKVNRIVLEQRKQSKEKK